MQKFIQAAKVYSDFKAISDEVIRDNVTFIVLKHSKPAYEIKPFDKKELVFESKKKQKKYNADDLEKFTFTSKNEKEKNLAKNFKKYIY